MDDEKPVELSNIDVNLKLFNKEFITGNLCVSKHHLMIMDLNKSHNDILLQHKAIDTIKFLNDYTLEIRTKNFEIYQLEVNSHNARVIWQLNSSLIRASNEDRVNELFPFIYKPEFKIIENGWTAFLLREEFTEILMSGMWSLFPTNECSSYDKSVIVPIKTSNDDVKESARLHVNNRFPVLAFYYKPSQSSLLRCSQYVPNNDRMPSSDPLIKLLTLSHSFIDIRSKAVIKSIPLEARILKNGVFHLEKIESLQSSFQKFIETCQDTTGTLDRYLSKLENSQWLDRVRQMLYVSRFVAHTLLSQSGNYIVIGDTGYDFELVVTSLVQVILHSDARTIRGFEALVDREWVQAGHPFYDRCKHQCLTNKLTSSNTTNETESPVFLLFLDCVWQIMQFNPTSFEFNELFLKCLAQHCYYSEFGTFLGNNAQHRDEFNITNETTSLWSFINQNDILYTFYNRLYTPCGKESRNYICWPPVLPQNIEIWQELYFGQSIPSIEIKRKIQDEIIKEYKASKNLNLKLRKFEALVDREWVQAGHPFYDRCKHQCLTNKLTSSNTTNETESPVFLLFLDCVWQIMQFNPTSFEFNELFLKCLAQHCYYSEFGTFLGNNAQHRDEFNIINETTSLWSFINQNDILHTFYNRLYTPCGKESRNYICWPPVLPQNIEIWQELYFGQSIPSIEIKRKIQDEIIKEYKASKNLNLKLRKLVESIEKELSLSNGINE